MFEISNYWNRMIWNQFSLKGMNVSISSALKLYGEHFGQNILEVPILLE